MDDTLYIEIVEVEYEPGDTIGPFPPTVELVKLEQRSMKYFATFAIYHLADSLDETRL